MKIFFSFVIFLFTLESMVRVLHVDIRLIAPLLFYSPADPDVYRPSSDPELLYELIPGKTHEFRYGYHVKENELKYPRKVSVNELGYRYSPWPKEKQPGKFRIAVFGGSNVYGFSVDDEHTWPYLLFQALEKKYPGRFEVWNGGITASVLSYKMRRAEIAMTEIKPDLIIVKHFFNTGRRAFYAKSYEAEPDTEMLIKYDHFSQNPELWEENIPLFLRDSSKYLSAHRYMVRNFATYRVILALIDRKTVGKITMPNLEVGCVDHPDECPYLMAEMNYVAREISERKVDEFKAKFPEQSVIFFDPVRNIYCKNEKSNFHGYPVFSLCTDSLPGEYRDIHPPVYVYRYYVEKIMDHLEKNKLIPQKSL